MKSIFRHASVLLPTLLLAACASTQGTAYSSKPAIAPASEPTITKDAAYMAQVERIAQRRGVQVVWVNPPDKRQTKVAASH